MVYVTSDGRVSKSKPFGVKYIVDAFWAFLAMIILFFRGLFHMDDPSSKGQYGRAPAFPRRRMGGFRNSGPPPPPCAGGG